MKTRKRLTKAERENREGMMELIKWTRILVVRRLIEAGWTNGQLGNTWEAMDKEIARLVLSHSVPDHHWCDETQIADLVTETMLAIQFDRWGEVIR